MEYVGRLGSIFTSVHNFYNEINPATLSGAIDIVVVEQEDGDLACSPFHVRFGKLSVLMPQEKRVQIKVNGQVVPYVMKVGEAGEAFFVFETEHEVPEEFQTSPIMEAVPEKLQEDPPYLDIGESKDKPEEKQETTTTGTTTAPAADTFEDDDSLKKLPLPAELQSPKMIIEEQMDKVVTKMDPYNTHDEHIELPEPQIYPVDDGHIVERVIPEAITTTTVAKERFIVRPAGGDLYNTLMEVTHTSVNKEDSKGDESIVLDIAGYKTGGDEWSEDQAFATPGVNANTEALEKEMTHLLLDENGVHSPPALDGLEPADLDVNKQSEEKNRGETSYQTAEDSSVAEESPQAVVVKEEEPKKSLWGWGSAKRQATNDSMDAPLSTPPTQPADTVQDHLALLPGQIYRIEMSLCGFSAFGKDEKENAQVFDQHKVTYDNFTHNPSMLNDKRLVFRYSNRYYAAGRTGPLFTSLLLYKKPLEETPQDEEEAADSRVSYSYGTGWRQWLSRSSVAAAPPTTTTTTTTGNTADSKDTSTTTQLKEETAAAAAAAAAAAPNLATKEEQETTTFTTTTTTTSVGWSADHVHPGQSAEEQAPHKVYAKTLRLTSDQLKSLCLKKGVNTISFSVSSAYQGTATCAAKIFYWDYGIQVVISDIDGTITKSDTLGHVFTMIGKDWTHMGVAKLYTDIANNGYHFLYLTSRAIGQADYTRDYLKKVAQDKYQLPDGPVIMSPDRLFTSLHREVIMRKPEVFKMACLRDVQRLFGGRDPFYAGFGNRITDARSYRSVNVPASRIFTIDPYGDLKLELLLGFKSSYIHLNDLVDQIFPPINRVVDEEFNDWNYWKAPVADIDIPELDVPVEPVSPKPKPIKPDPSALPASSVVASTSSSSGRGLLRSFTSRSDSSSSSNNSNISHRKLQSSSSTPTLLSRKFSISSNTSGDENLANDNEVTSDQKAGNAGGTTTTVEDLSTSPTNSIMNKILSVGGVRSTLSRTFLSSDNNSSNHTSGTTTPQQAIEEEKAEQQQQEKEEEEEEEDKPLTQQEQDHIDQDVDALLDDDIDMDDIPFI
ncbi:mRNA 3' end processing factor [Mucor velutinosus]|uniref:phosphatidate phosphatase n=1 Tax=Mucor velutinosus TaxID=708070 RepID=A0AAN7HS32_9FUNG|nr:mRNA 3' end processing factor [Mucor velutinosus]